MAKAGGARVVGTARSDVKAKQAKDLGADLSVDTTTEDFAEKVKLFGGADVILDMVGGDYAPRNIDCLRPGGRLVYIAFQAGSRIEIDVQKVMQKRLSITGSTLRPRSSDEKARLAAAVEAKVWPWIARGMVKSVVDRRFPISQAAAAHAWLEQGAHVGKVVLEL